MLGLLLLLQSSLFMGGPLLFFQFSLAGKKGYREAPPAGLGTLHLVSSPPALALALLLQMHHLMLPHHVLQSLYLSLLFFCLQTFFEEILFAIISQAPNLAHDIIIIF